MAVELLGAKDGIRFEAWILPYPRSLVLSRGFAYLYALQEEQALLSAGQLRFRGAVDDLVDGLALLAMADEDQRVRLDGGLLLSWVKTDSARKVSARTPEDPRGRVALASFDFDVFSGAVSQLAMASYGGGS